MKASIPFSGFYQSTHDRLVDRTLEDMFDNNDGLVSEATFHFNFAPVFEQYAREYAAQFCVEHEIEGKFSELWSPREYNFMTDVIFITLTQKEARRIRDKTSVEALVKIAEERFTSGPGFVSFIDPNICTWGPVTTWNEHQLGALLSAYAQDLDEDALMESALCNGKIEEWLTQSNPVVMGRLLKIRDYLNARGERE